MSFWIFFCLADIVLAYISDCTQCKNRADCKVEYEYYSGNYITVYSCDCKDGYTGEKCEEAPPRFLYH